MGYEFTVKVDKALSVRDLLAHVPTSNVKILPPPGDELVAETSTTRAYVEGRSTRGVECSNRTGEFVVQVQAMASTEDYELALTIIEAASAHCEAPIHAEFIAQPISRVDLRKLFGCAWIQENQRSSIRILDHITKRDGGKIITVPALFRACHYGQHRLSELRGSSTESEFAARVIEDVRQIQYMEAGDYYEAVAYDGDGENGVEFTYTPWLPSTKYWFPKIDYFFVGDRDEDAPYLPASVLKQLPPTKIRWLDDVQVLVETFSPSEWKEFMTATRHLRCEPHAEFKRREARARRKQQ